MPKQMRTRSVSAAQTRSYVGKAAEYLAAASAELEADRSIAATSLAIHAAINAADAVTGVRIGRRAAGQDHDQVLSLLRDAGQDGAEVERNLARLAGRGSTPEAGQQAAVVTNLRAVGFQG